MKRPLLSVVLLYVCGILAAEVISLPLLPILGVSLFLVALAVSLPRFRFALLYPLIILAGFENSTLRTAIISPFDLRRILGAEAHLVCIRCNLAETPHYRVYGLDEKPEWRTTAGADVHAVRLDKGPWQPACGRIVVTVPALLTNYFSDQLVQITGVVDVPGAAVAEGMFDYRQYLKRQGIYYLLRAESENDWRGLGSSPALPLADRFSRWARHALAIGLPVEDESLRLEWALALGWKTALTEEASESFVQAATYHIFAVDGLRMAIIFGILYSVLRTTGLARSVCGVVLIPVIWFYVALTGWPASAIRATVMLTVIILGWMLKRPGNPLNSLFAAALIILLWDPQQLFQAGFQLSFLVVLCLILTVPPMFSLAERLTAPDPLLPQQLHRHWHALVRVPARYIGDLFVTSLAAWIGSLPLVACYFNLVSPVSTPANILAVPLCVLVLIGNMISLCLAGWFPPGAALFNHASWFCMESIRISSRWFAHWPMAYYYVPAPGFLTIFVYYAILLALVSGWALRPAHRAWRFAALALALSISIGNSCRQLPVTKLTVLPVHGGTSIYYDAFGLKRDLLIDVGSTNSVRLITKPYLRAQGMNRSPPVLLTHGDLHHIGGIEPFKDVFAARHIYISPLHFRSVAYRRIIERLGQSAGLLSTMSRGDVIGDWAVLHPEASDRFARADDGALVLKSVIRGTPVLLLSDLGRSGQNALMQRTSDLHADIVVAGLPAAEQPLCDALLEAIHPRLVIISDSALPVSERANAKLRARLRQTHLPVLYTCVTGSVSLGFRDHYWELRTVGGFTLNSSQPDLRSAIEEIPDRAKLLPRTPTPPLKNESSGFPSEDDVSDTPGDS